MRHGRYLGGLLVYTRSAMQRYDVAVTRNVFFVQWGHAQWCLNWRFWR
jgi:hypothetical protein